MKRSFRRWLEAVDIFGFDKEINPEKNTDINAKPINQFNIELMMEFLSKKSLGLHSPYSPFISEMVWGEDLGAVKLEIDTGLTFYIKKKGKDLLGDDRWITKKMFQLNRHGYKGMEDFVSQEIFEHIERVYNEPTPAAQNGYTELENLTFHLYNKMRMVAKDIFIPVGIRQVDEDSYIIAFEVRGHGLEAQDQRRVEQNQTIVTYDKESGTIRVFNYNIESPVGGQRKCEIMENDLDIYFFPTQDREEISECLAVHFKYY